MRTKKWDLLGLTLVVSAFQAISSGATSTAGAQTEQQQYAIYYGEFVPKPGALRQGGLLLDHLARLAGNTRGLRYFAVNSEIGRPNFFALVEVWQDATSFSNFKAQSDVQRVEQLLTPLLLAPLDERDGNLVQ
jgi:quinol monooxygenase YgiN